ncbi:MAG: sigma-70 family RNA polymerase sigma factor [Vicinamibacterales bacterium]
MYDRPRETDVTRLLAQWRGGDRAALEQLVPLVYQELRRVARARLRGEGVDHTLQTTALVHEAYLRLANLNRMTLSDRGHFFAMAARLMREILVDHARRRNAAKRGGGATKVDLDHDHVAHDLTTPLVDVLGLDEALTALALFDERLGRVVELRFFAGLSIAETAAALGVSPATVERDWTVAKAWLHQRLTAGV